MAEGPGPAPTSAAGTPVKREALPKLLNLLLPVVHCWDLFAQQIGVPPTQIALIKLANPQTGPNYLYKCFTQVLEWWVANHDNPVYETMIGVLDPGPGQVTTSIVNRALASELREFTAKKQALLFPVAGSVAHHISPGLHAPTTAAEVFTQTNQAMIQGKFACLLEFMEMKLQQKLAAERIKRQLRLFVIRLYNVPDSSIPVSSDVSVIFEAMRSHKLLTYLNIAGLEQIIQRYCKDDSEVEAKLKQYKKDQSGFELATKLNESDYISKARSKFPYRCDEPASDIQPKRTPSYLTALTVNLEHHVAEYHLDYLQELWQQLSNVLSLPPLYLILDAVIMNDSSGPGAATASATPSDLPRATAEPAKPLPSTATLEESRKRRARVLFDEALKKGYILCHINKCIMLGHAGAGKTHVMYRLFDKDPPAVRCSTALAEAPIRAISRIIIGAVKRSVDWFQVSGEELMAMLAQAVQAGVPMEGEGEEQQPVMEDGSLHDGSLSPNGSARQQIEDVATVSKESDPAKEIPNEESSPPVKELRLNVEPSGEQVSPSSKEIIEMMETLPESRRLLEICWVHFIDTGGQPHFHELFSSFVKNATAAVCVVKLNERLDQNPMIEYYQGGRPCGNPCPSALSTAQILQHCVQTVHSQMIPPSVQMGTEFIVVGTHRDLEHTCTETRAEKNKKLLQILRPIVGEGLMFYGQLTKEVIFPMNAKEPEAEDREVAALIRKRISKKRSPFKVPVGWFLLEQDIRKLGKGVVSKGECREIAAKLKINDESLEAALAYLHKLNISLYYPDFLPEVVFSESQVLFDKITELVAFGYQLRCPSPSRDAFEGRWLCFRDEGIVTRELLKLERFSKHYVPGLFTPDDLLYLLEHLLIVSPRRNSSFTDYFMPSLLPSISREALEGHRLSSTSIVAPLLVYFPDGCAPNGLFCALVVYLLSTCGWKVAYQSFTPSCIATPSCVARNCIEFNPPVPGSATLINSYTHFEVHPRIPERFYPSFCRKACQDIFHGLESASERLDYDSPKSKPAFFCRRHCTEPAHAAVVFSSDDGQKYAMYSSDDGQKYAKCTEDTRVFDELEWRHTVWLKDTNTSTVGITCQDSVKALLRSEAELEESDMAEISKYLIKLDKTHLLNLGVVLGLSYMKLHGLQDSPTFMNALVARWILKQDYVIEKGLMPTWRNLVVALKNELVGQTGLARDIARDKGIEF